MLNDKKRTWAEVKATALQYNYYKIRSYIDEGCKMMGVVKANAYGHGAYQVAKMLERFGCDYLGVAALDEAESLRAAGIKLPILILSHTPAVFIERVVDADCIQALSSLDDAKAYSRVMEKCQKTLKVHVKLETGMGRTGFGVRADGVKKVLSAIELSGIEAEGIFTHFASADDPGQEDYTLSQFKLFMDAIEEIEKNYRKKFAIRHCANSAAMISYPQTHLDMVRAGISLYGVYPGEDHGTLDLSPAMELRTRVLQVLDLEPGQSVSYGRSFTADKKMKVAVLAAGYADGVHRVLSNKIDVLIHGTRCKQVGTICMDMLMADVTGLEGVRPDDMAVVFGHDEREVISVNDVAEKAGTISYEMLCSVSSRVPRVYVN